MWVYGWPEAELKRHRHVRLATRGQQRNLPALVLHVAGKTKARAREDIRVHRNVILGSTLWKILRVNLPVPEFQTDFLPRPQPVVCLDQFAL